MCMCVSCTNVCNSDGVLDILSTFKGIGIIPEPIRSQIYDEMVAYAGDNGVVIVVYYNGNNFADGVENFYKKNPVSRLAFSLFFM